jgi:transcriptional regulator with XRE-family HTH domain
MNARKQAQEGTMRFSDRLKELRLAKNLSQRALALEVGVNFTYLSKIENEKLGFADYPSEEMICKLARALDADVDELLILADKIPTSIRQRVKERPDAFRKLASLDDVTLDNLMVHLGEKPIPEKTDKQKAR